MNAAEKCKGVGFGDALRWLNEGRKVRRAGWNGKGMWLKLIHGGEYEIAPGALDSHNENPCNLKMLPWIGMRTADEKFVPWLASQTDVLASDWEAVE